MFQERPEIPPTQSQAQARISRSNDYSYMDSICRLLHNKAFMLLVSSYGGFIQPYSRTALAFFLTIQNEYFMKKAKVFKWCAFWIFIFLTDLSSLCSVKMHSSLPPEMFASIPVILLFLIIAQIVDVYRKPPFLEMLAKPKGF